MSRTTERPRVIREIERKYETSSDRVLPSLSGLAGVAGEPVVDTFELSALYYDTSDHRLLDLGITLRRREGGDDAGWHLKLPAGTDTRTEVQLPESRDSDTVPAELADLLTAVTGEHSLAPIAQITTDRERHSLRDDTGATLVEVVSDRVVAAVPNSTDDRARKVWREIEVEQISGDRAVAEAVDERLMTAGATRSELPSKLHRAVGNAHRATRPDTDTDTDTDTDPSSDPRAGLTVYLRAHTRALLLADIDRRRRVPEAVHDLRVAARRLRSALQVYGYMIADGDLVGATIEDLRWIGRQLGESRDIEVQRQRFDGHIDTTEDIPDRDAVRDLAETYFDTLAESAEQVAADTMSSRRYLAVIGSLTTLAADCATTTHEKGKKAARKDTASAVEHLSSKVGSRIRKAAKAHDPTSRGELLHRARKGVKRLRYAVEVMHPAHPKRVDRALNRYKGLQKMLGEHQDSMVARRHALTMLEQPGHRATTGFGLGLLYAGEVFTDIADSPTLRAEWKKARKATHSITK